MAQKQREQLNPFKGMKPISVLAISIASVLMMTAYLVFVGLTAVAFVVWTNGLGLGTASPGGFGLFTFLVGLELALVLVFNKPAPFIFLFAVPAIVGYVAVKQAYSSKMAEDVFKKVESAIRNPTLVRGF